MAMPPDAPYVKKEVAPPRRPPGGFFTLSTELTTAGAQVPQHLLGGGKSGGQRGKRTTPLGGVVGLT